jgi:hypothetical protein
MKWKIMVVKLYNANFDNVILNYEKKIEICSKMLVS